MSHFRSSFLSKKKQRQVRIFRVVHTGAKKDKTSWQTLKKTTRPKSNASLSEAKKRSGGGAGAVGFSLSSASADEKAALREAVLRERRAKAELAELNAAPPVRDGANRISRARRGMLARAGEGARRKFFRGVHGDVHPRRSRGGLPRCLNKKVHPGREDSGEVFASGGRGFPEGGGEAESEGEAPAPAAPRSESAPHARRRNVVRTTSARSSRSFRFSSRKCVPADSSRNTARELSESPSNASRRAAGVAAFA